MPDPEGLPPAPLGDEVRLDDPTEDHARSNHSVADAVEFDLDDPTSPSHRTRDGGAAGFDVDTEPLELPDGVEIIDGRRTDDLPPL